MDRIIAVLLLLAAMPAAAQTIYKCADAKGGTVYQSHPCEDGKPAGKQWVTERRSETPAEVYQRQAAERKVEQDRQALRARNQQHSGVPIARGAHVQGRQASQCEQAKASRESALRNAGMNRTHALLRRLDDMVYEACK